MVETMLILNVKLEIHLLHQMLSRPTMFQTSKGLKISHIRPPTIQVGGTIRISHGETTKEDSNHHHPSTSPKRRNNQIWKRFWENSLKKQELSFEIKKQSIGIFKINSGNSQGKLQKELKDPYQVIQ